MTSPEPEGMIRIPAPGDREMRLKLPISPTAPCFYWLTHHRCLLETKWRARVHASPHQKDPFAPARAFSILDLPSFSHTQGKRGIVSSGNATSCNFISSSVERTAGEHDNNTGPLELEVFFRGDHVQCPSFTPPPPPTPSKTTSPSSLAPEMSQQLAQNNDGTFWSVCM